VRRIIPSAAKRNWRNLWVGTPIIRQI